MQWLRSASVACASHLPVINVIVWGAPFLVLHQCSCAVLVVGFQGAGSGGSDFSMTLPEVSQLFAEVVEEYDMSMKVRCVCVCVCSVCSVHHYASCADPALVPTLPTHPAGIVLAISS